MKNTLVTAFMVLVMTVPPFAFAGPFDVFDKLKQEDAKGDKVDVPGLSARGTALIAKVAKATIAFGEAVVETQYAIGNAASAEKLKAAINNAKAKKDESTTKVLVGEVNNAVSEMNQIDLQAKMDINKARVSLGKSILKLGSGILLDTSAVSEAKALMTETSGAIKAVQAAPMQYGPVAVKNVQSASSASQFTVENIPPQITSVSTFMGKLVEYAKTNKIEVPSKEETEKMAQNMEKE